MSSDSHRCFTFFRQLFSVPCLSVEDCHIDLVLAGGRMDYPFPSRMDLP